MSRAVGEDQYPESEHVLDWFHITMRLTVLNQFARGLIHTDPKLGEQIKNDLDRTKWFLWHGNVLRALDALVDIMIHVDDPDLRYDKRRKFISKLEELDTYIRNNEAMIPNYGERWRNDERISTSFVESTVNEVVAKRMVKKQQMQWSTLGSIKKCGVYDQKRSQARMAYLYQLARFDLAQAQGFLNTMQFSDAERAQLEQVIEQFSHGVIFD